jgi:hypothetical protein
MAPRLLMGPHPHHFGVESTVMMDTRLTAQLPVFGMTTTGCMAAMAMTELPT